MIKAIAIDDEPIALEVIKKLSSDVLFLDMAGCFTNAFQALDYLQNNKVDLIFLDINMPNISGIELLKSISSPPLVIFTTGYSEYAVQSFELDVLDYLLKPFSLPRFLKACNKAQQQINFKSIQRSSASAHNHIFIKSGYEQVRIEISEIVYIEGTGNYIQINLKDRIVVSRITMGDIEAILPNDEFVRFHRSFIVAKNQVTKIDKRSLWIADKEFPIGALFSKEIAKILR